MIESIITDPVAWWTVVGVFCFIVGVFISVWLPKLLTGVTVDDPDEQQDMLKPLVERFRGAEGQ